MEITAEIIRRDYDGKNIDEASNTVELNVALVRQAGTTSASRREREVASRNRASNVF